MSIGKPIRILNLFAGIGGNRKLWDQLAKQYGIEIQVTAVEIDYDIAVAYKQQFPNDEVIIADAHEYLLEHFAEFDIIWSSPPCQTHSHMRAHSKSLKEGKIEPMYFDMKLPQEIEHMYLMDKLGLFNGKYVIENVQPWHRILPPFQSIGRTKLWANFNIEFNFEIPPRPNHERGTKEEWIQWYGYESDLPVQVYRNTVDPVIGREILRQAIAPPKQIDLDKALLRIGGTKRNNKELNK